MRIVIAALLGFAVSACAIAEDEVSIGYIAPPNIEITEGAQDVTLAVEGEDGRVANMDRISTKKNGYGMEMAAIRAENDVVQLVTQAVEHEFESLGFNVGESQNRVKVSLDTFYTDFKLGFWNSDAVAEVAFTLTAYEPDGGIAYSRSYKGVGIEEGIMIANGSNAGAALEKALTAAMSVVVADTDLHRALVDAANLPAVSSVPTS